MLNLIPKERIFILGAPRSGTTFLASLLRKTKFGSPVETHFITKYFKRLDQYGDLSKKANFVRLASDVLAERPVMQWELGVSATELYEILSPAPSFGALTDQLLLMARNKDGDNSNSEAWGDKTPHYLGDWPILTELFPDAKFVFIARDGRDVALSLFQKPWGPSTTIGCALYWKRLNREKFVFEKILKTDQLLCLTYEEIIHNPQKYVQTLYEFLGESLPSGAVEELSKPTKRQNANKWRSSMTARQKRQFEAVAGEQLLAMGYSLSLDNPKLFPGELLLSRCLEVINHVRFLFYINIIEGFKIRFLGSAPFAD